MKDRLERVFEKNLLLEKYTGEKYVSERFVARLIKEVPSDITAAAYSRMSTNMHRTCRAMVEEDIADRKKELEEIKKKRKKKRQKIVDGE